MDNQEKSSLGIDDNVAGLLCYLAGWLTGLIFFLLEKQSSFVKFHALQSIYVFATVTVVLIVLNIISAIIWSLAWRMGGFLFAIPTFIGIISFVVWIISFALWVVLMVKAYQGEKFQLPVFGPMAEKHSGN